MKRLADAVGVRRKRSVSDFVVKSHQGSFQTKQLSFKGIAASCCSTGGTCHMTTMMTNERRNNVIIQYHHTVYSIINRQSEMRKRNKSLGVDNKNAPWSNSMKLRSSRQQVPRVHLHPPDDSEAGVMWCM